jgi:hypothetical protein
MLPNHLGHDDQPSLPKNRNFTGEILGRNQHRAPIEAQQPKTKPDDAFDILGCSETLQENENASTRLVT